MEDSNEKSMLETAEDNVKLCYRGYNRQYGYFR